MNPYDKAARHLVFYGGHRHTKEGRDLVYKAIRYLRGVSKKNSRGYIAGLRCISGQFPVKAEGK